MADDDGVDSASDDACTMLASPTFLPTQANPPFDIRPPTSAHVSSTARTSHVVDSDSNANLPIISPTDGGDGVDDENNTALAKMRLRRRHNDAGMIMSRRRVDANGNHDDRTTSTMRITLGQWHDGGMMMFWRRLNDDSAMMRRI